MLSRYAREDLGRLLAVAAFALLPAAVARAQVQREVDRPRFADAPRWASFVGLVASRWAARVSTSSGRRRKNRQRAADCVADAWYLSLPRLLDGGRSPCVRLAAALARPKGTSWRAEAERRARWAARLRHPRRAPVHREYRSCMAKALREGDSRMVEICAHAVEPRADRMASLSDAERFGGWLRSCKKAILGTDTSFVSSPESLPEGIRAKAGTGSRTSRVRPARAGGAPGRASSRSPSRPRRDFDRAEDEEARHCVRTLPTLYEVQGLKKLSDYWTPAELRALRRRSDELGREGRR